MADDTTIADIPGGVPAGLKPEALFFLVNEKVEMLPSPAL